MSLHPQAQAYLDALVATMPPGPPLEERPVADVRAFLARGRGVESDALATEGPKADVPVSDVTIERDGATFGARVYAPPTDEPLPVVVFFHGGCYVLGDLGMHDPSLRRLAVDTPAVVVSVDYRLAPEHPFPTGPEDCYAATVWAAEHAPAYGGDPSRLVVTGDSAGAGLAAAVALMARDRGGPGIALQLLVYPMLDRTMSLPSHRTYGGGDHLLRREFLAWSWRQYLGEDAHGTAAAHPYASPLRDADDLRGLAPAHVLLAECDPIVDDGEAYAQRLAEAGVPVTVSRYPGQIHGFAYMLAVLDDAATAIAEMAGAVRACTSSVPPRGGAGTAPVTPPEEQP